MNFKMRTDLQEADQKLTGKDKQLVKKVLDVTGDLTTAMAVGNAKIAEKSNKNEDFDLQSQEEDQEIASPELVPAAECRKMGLMIGNTPYTWIEEDILEIFNYYEITQDDITDVEEGRIKYLISESDIIEAVRELFDYNDNQVFDVVSSIIKYLNDFEWFVDSAPEKGSREYNRRLNAPGRSRKRKKSFFDLDYDMDEDLNSPKALQLSQEELTVAENVIDEVNSKNITDAKEVEKIVYRNYLLNDSIDFDKVLDCVLTELSMI